MMTMFLAMWLGAQGMSAMPLYFGSLESEKKITIQLQNLDQTEEARRRELNSLARSAAQRHFTAMLRQKLGSEGASHLLLGESVSKVPAHSEILRYLDGPQNKNLWQMVGVFTFASDGLVLSTEMTEATPSRLEHFNLHVYGPSRVLIYDGGHLNAQDLVASLDPRDHLQLNFQPEILNAIHHAILDKGGLTLESLTVWLTVWDDKPGNEPFSALLSDRQKLSLLGLDNILTRTIFEIKRTGRYCHKLRYGRS